MSPWLSFLVSLRAVDAGGLVHYAVEISNHTWSFRCGQSVAAVYPLEGQYVTCIICRARGLHDD